MRLLAIITGTALCFLAGLGLGQWTITAVYVAAADPLALILWVLLLLIGWQMIRVGIRG